LQGTYTQRYNARYRERGHVFQGRYKAMMIEPDEQAFTARVSTYIHLNPLRAGLIRWPEEKLGAYVWSSYPAYIGQVHAPAWLELGRVWGSQGFEGRCGSGRGYGRMLERLCGEWATEKGRKLIMGDWNALRRGWCLGDESFREQMGEALARVVEGKRRETYGGEEMREHDERAAERLLVQGLERLGLKREALEGLKKSDARKQVLAWWLRSRTTVSVAWIQEQLKLGFRTSVSNAVACVKSGDDPELLRLHSVVMSD